ncbi:hypothetical protein V494_02489, partial [Pseudogymnoascus sp. VKM F-4513 (FW-928)]
MLVGHSCGATLAFQVPITAPGGEALPVPRCILGSEGIYDIPSLVARNSHPAYREFVTAAFGDDESAWVAASPLLAHRDRDAKDRLWEEVGIVFISHSEED